MPRGYVRTGKNADPEFIRQRAALARSAKEDIDRLVRRIAARADELTADHRALLAAVAGGEA
jgi:hypothetical protein